MSDYILSEAADADPGIIIVRVLHQRQLPENYL
jgi:plasmid stabilization system protein ParE